MIIRTAQTPDLPQIRCLWEECFPDSSGFNPYFFQMIFRPEQTVLLFEQDNLCAMLQMLPYSLRIGREAVPVTYIYGACTAVRARKKGYMAQLLHWSFSWDQAHGRAASILIPQEPWLFDFYAKYGYRTAFYTVEHTVSPLPQADAAVRRCTLPDVPALQQAYVRITQAHPLVLLRTEEQWRAQLTLFDVLGAGAYALFDGADISAFAFVWESEQELWAQELLAADENAQLRLCAALRAQFPDKPVRISTIGGDTPLGCAKFYKHNPRLTGYFNLLYQ